MAFEAGAGVVSFGAEGVEDVASAMDSVQQGLDKVSKATFVSESAVLDLGVDLRGVLNAIPSMFSKITGAAKGFVGILGRIGTAVTGIGIAYLGFDALKSSLHGMVNEAAGGETALEGLDAVFQSTGNIAGVTAAEIESIGRAFEETTIYGKDAIVAANKYMAAMTNVRGDVFKRATADAVDLAAAMDMDIGQATEYLGRALQMPERGLMQLRRVGVVFTADQEKMIKQMMKLGDVPGAQKIVLDQMEARFKGAATKMGTTYEGAMTRITASLGDLRGQMGDMLLPLLTKFANWFADKALPALKTWVLATWNAIGNIVSYLSDLLAPAWNWIAGLSKKVLSKMGEWWLVFAKVTWTSIAVMITAISNWKLSLSIAKEFVLMELGKLSDYMNWIFMEAIPRILVWFGDNWINIFSDIATFIGTVTTNIVDNLFNWAKGVVDIFIGLGKTVIEIMKNSFTTMWEVIKKVLSGDLGGAIDLLLEAPQKAMDSWSKNMEGTLKNFTWTPLMEGWDGAMTEALPDLGKAVESEFTKAHKNALGELKDQFVSKIPEFPVGLNADLGGLEEEFKKRDFDIGRQTGEGAAGGIVSLEDIAKNLQVAAFKMKDPAQIANEQLGVQSESLEVAYNMNDNLSEIAGSMRGMSNKIGSIGELA